MRTLDLSLANTAVWSGCEIETLAGKLTVVTPPEEAVALLASNLGALPISAEGMTLTGAAPIWAYLVAFHFLHGRTKRVYYQDGRGQRLLVAAHG